MRRPAHPAPYSPIAHQPEEAGGLGKSEQTLRGRLSRMSDISLRITESLDLETFRPEVVDGARPLSSTPGVAQGLFPSRCSPDDKRAGSPFLI